MCAFSSTKPNVCLFTHALARLGEMDDGDLVNVCMKWVLPGSWFVEAEQAGRLQPVHLFPNGSDNMAKMRVSEWVNALEEIGTTMLPLFGFRLTQLKGVLSSQRRRATTYETRILASIGSLIMSFCGYLSHILVQAEAGHLPDNA